MRYTQHRCSDEGKMQVRSTPQTDPSMIAGNLVAQTNLSVMASGNLPDLTDGSIYATGVKSTSWHGWK